LNARDAGITLQATTATDADLHLERLALASANPRVALRTVARELGLPEPKLSSDSVEELYQAEAAMLQTQQVVPLFQLPTSYALNANVQDWNQDRDGAWHLEYVWLVNKP